MMNRIKRAAVVLSAAVLLAAGGTAAYAAADDTVPEIQPVTAAAEANEYEITPVDYTYDHYEVNVDSNGNVTAKEKKSKNWVEIILVALGISVVVTGITVYVIYRGYKYNGMTEPYEFKNKAPLDLREKEDQLIDVHVTSVHINRDNN